MPNTVVYGTSGNDPLTATDGTNYSLFGVEGSDTLTGANGDDFLNGGIGADIMAGGLGNDSYVVDNADDVVIENAGGGTDIVYASVSFKLGANIENLYLTGTGDINGVGNDLNNVMSGNAGNNVLDGGAGNDNINGGDGNDVIQGGLGNDYIVGGNGNDQIDGGAGNDTLIGGAGNDGYVIDSLSDKIIEAAGGGTDMVNVSFSYTLGDNLENLVLRGTDNINGTGNGLDNVIFGNTGNNTLSGLGGNDQLYGNAGTDTLLGGEGNDYMDGAAGADSMTGGNGNDIYAVDNTNDTVTELAGQGTDKVLSSLFTYTLGDNVENLSLIQDTIATVGNGNSLDNVIIGNDNIANVLNGNDGNDTLYGLGGADVLTGGAGNDTFLFSVAADNGIDVITDFAHGQDTLAFKSSEYAGLTTAVGHLTVNLLGTASGAGAQFTYSTLANTLLFDADGAGGAAAVAIAVINPLNFPFTVDASDFTFV